ncbi:cysteine hydrolase family protein [Alistipes sp. ZOR0009]|uniref:cysteine hydrolase family protein n=1 Tax=Alistipes sp. ZOR0009 TaxID=1339253 RepID=UPI00064711A3|nr:cysteine hydrolase family protein [Alistipes sp. ZOR0009]
MNTALILIDIQNDYFEGGAMTLDGSEKASSNAKLLLNHFRSKGLPVLHVQHIATRPTATFFVPNTKGAEIHANVAPLADEKVVVKHFPNSFRETDLQDWLNSNEIANLTICGMMTHMCVDATVRAAKDLGYECTLVADACATKNLEIQNVVVNAKDVHNSFTAALSYFYATVTNTEEYLSTQ